MFAVIIHEENIPFLGKDNKFSKLIFIKSKTRHNVPKTIDNHSFLILPVAKVGDTVPLLGTCLYH